MDTDSAGLIVRILRKGTSVCEAQLSLPMEFGRQDVGEPNPYQLSGENGNRFIIAYSRENYISRRQVRLDPLPGSGLRVTNLGTKTQLMLDSGPLACGKSRDIELQGAMRIDLAGLELCLESPHLEGLPQRSPDCPQTDRKLDDTVISGFLSGQDPEALLKRWLETSRDVLQAAAATSEEFIPQAARAVANIVGLDSTAVMRWDGSHWNVESLYRADADSAAAWTPSMTILNRVRAEQRTFRAIPSASVAESLSEVSALVASPIVIDGKVWGAIYGDRRTQSTLDPGISESAAMLVETLACAVANGLARLEHEKRAMTQRLRFEQFFTSDLARKLESQPDMLRAKDAEVTVLFCDIRGFSTITERLGPAESIEWINDTLEELSKCVLAHGGVLVDYVGDELMAMWGAPDPQPDHAARACLAATEMFNRLPELNDRWESRLGVPTGLAIGINSGMARVGNVGSKCKFKYGALGNTVNVASRVQGAAKYVNTDVLVTRSTAVALDAQFCTRRLCLVRLVNMVEPVELHELETNPDPDWPEFKRQYESALEAFHRGDFHSAGRTLGNMLEKSRDDGPTAVLLRRAVTAITEPPESFDPVWKLSGK